MTALARRVLLPALDGLIAVLLLAVVAIAVTGGGVFTISDIRIRARSIDNPLIALALFAGLRAVAGRAVPFLGLRGTAPVDLAARTRAWIDRLSAAAAAMPSRLAWQLVIAAATISLAVKLANAWLHPGFFSGDDLEIQEMSLAAVLGRPWPIWELRSAVFPMAFVYPVQAVAASMGVTDVGTLVALGRSVVAVLSTAAIAFVFLAVRREASTPAAVAAAMFVAVNPLLVTFGGTELPRPVAAALLAGAYVLLQQRTRVATTMAAIAVAMAALLRFSEVIFVAPAALQLLGERRRREAVRFALVALATMAAVQAAADWWYWGEPFHSLRQVVRFTLVEGQSTRGYQPPWYYLTSIGTWADPVIAVLATLAVWRGAWRPALWVLVPLAALSLLPHKEPRYLIPLSPFVAMLAGRGAWDLITAIARRTHAPASPQWRALLLVAALAASLLISINRFHVRRTNDAVRHAREVAAVTDVRGVAVDQLWRWGGRLYVGHVPVLIDLDGRLPDADALRREAASQNLDWIALRDDTCRRLDCVAVLDRAGFAEHDAAGGNDRLFRRVR